MLHRAMWALLAAALIGLACANTEAGELRMLTGMVIAATPNAKEAATLKVGNVFYKIVKDANVRKVAAEAGGKKVEMKGIVEVTNGASWITVTSCKIVE